MLTFYPQIKPYVKHSLEVETPHTLYVEECGNPHGVPVVFLHGGPGAGCEPYHRQFFDPEVYRIILFDQRGCGRSSPHAELAGNTTQVLVADMERIREHLGVDKWLIFGGSWGSTLALVYSETHPERVSGLIVRGIFLCRPDEILWFYQRGADRIFPDYWEEFVTAIPEEERHDMVRAYYRRLTGDDEVLRMSAAKTWSCWEGRCATLVGRKEVVEHYDNPYNALSLARIESHYFVNHSFLAPNQIIDNAGALGDIPGVIVHGRYDMICPLENAWELHRAWPASQLQIIPGAGHSATERGIVDALIRATNEMAERLA